MFASLQLLVYDLQANKHEPVGETRVSKKARLTHVCFNPTEPIVLVGDETGNVVCLKLSPNLRKMSAPKIQVLRAASLNPHQELCFCVI